MNAKWLLVVGVVDVLKVRVDKPLCSFLDLGTAVCPVFLGHFSFAQNPGGPYRDRALHDRQGRRSVIPSASSHRHTHVDTHTHTHVRLQTGLRRDVMHEFLGQRQPQQSHEPSLYHCYSLSPPLQQLPTGLHTPPHPTLPPNRKKKFRLPCASFQCQIKWIRLHSGLSGATFLELSSE